MLLQTPPKDLPSILSQLPSRRAAILDHMRDLVQRLVSKKLFDFKYSQELIGEYTCEVTQDTARMNELVRQLSDALPRLLVSKGGARACCHLIAHGTAKDRKSMVKALKGKVLESLCHDSGHLGVMRLVEVTDDTVLVQKSLLEELCPKGTNEPPQYTASGAPSLPLRAHSFRP